MARTKQEFADSGTDLPEFKDEAGVVAELAEMHGNRMAVNQQFDLTIYDRNAVEEKIRFYMGQSTEAILNMGKLLVQLKENEPHGNWTESLRRIGLDDRLAQRMMKAAVKFSNAALTPVLIEAAGNKTKLFELLVLDDEDMKELGEGGTVAGIQLDDIARMSTTELRAALRKTKEEAVLSLKSKDDVIKNKVEELAKKNAAIDKLTEQLSHKKHSEAQTKEVELPETPLLRTLNENVLRIKSQITSTLNSDSNALYQLFNNQPPQHIELAIRQAIGQIITSCYDLASDLGVTPQLEMAQAAEDPVKADAEAFMQWQAEQEALEAEEAEEINAAVAEPLETQWHRE